ncbi:MAG: hypothetical protein JST80_00315 [Bdellovibrionales bacterium]|nr:hypothetical protein [Bdellovibrionales bacterium]
MKTIATFIFALVLNVSAQAAPKSYNCIGASGYITPDHFTLVATDYGFTVYFKGQGYERAKAASFVTGYGSKIPAVFGPASHSKEYAGAVLFTNKNPQNFFKGNDRTYKVLYAYANRNLLNKQEHGSIMVAFKQEYKYAPGSNAHEWVRAFSCSAK